MRFHRPQLLTVAVLGGGILCVLSFYNYLLFHTLVEIFSVVVAWGIFVLAWNTRAHMTQDSLFFIGAAYLFVGFFDLVHTLAYKGMGVFPSTTADQPTQLWICARYLEALALAIAPSYAYRKVRADIVFAFLGAISVLGVASIFYWDIFPDCFVEGRGLTSFKIFSEYLIIALMIVAMMRLRTIRHLYPARVFHLIIWVLAVSIGAEFCFTLYADVYGLFNMAGHLLKLVSFIILYEAVLQTGFREPLGLLFREIKQGAEKLLQEKERLAQKNLELARLSELKDQFLAMAAHDLHHPIGVTRMYGEFLLEEAAPALSPEHRDFLRVIVDSSRSMQAILNDFLDIAKIEAGRLELHKTPTDLESLIRGVVALHQWQASRKNIRIDLAVHGYSWRVEVDPTKMEQVMNNLLSNAVKFSPEGSRVQVSLTHEGRRIVVGVSDQGPGISKDNLDRLFQPFERIGSPQGRREKGSGLGLAIVKKIVEAHGGKVWIESEQGWGSTFYVAVPVNSTSS